MSENVIPLRDNQSRSNAEIRQQRKVSVALGYRIFAALRWGDLGDGHISARDPERTDCFWMLRYGVSYHQARVSDLVLVGPEGELVEGEGIINRAAYYIHYPILMDRPEAVSAAHVHTPWGTPFSAEVRPIEPISQESCVFFEDHAIFNDEEVQVQDTAGGKRISEAMGGNRAIIPAKSWAFDRFGQCRGNRRTLCRNGTGRRGTPEGPKRQTHFGRGRSLRQGGPGSVWPRKSSLLRLGCPLRRGHLCRPRIAYAALAPGRDSSPEPGNARLSHEKRLLPRCRLSKIELDFCFDLHIRRVLVPLTASI